MILSYRLTIFRLFISCLISLCPIFVIATDLKFEDGTHYVTLKIPIATKYDDKIEVTEYFSYGCPACYQFESVISVWVMSLANDVEFNRTPAIWNEPYKLYAQTYYTAEALNILEQIHPALFNAIQKQLLGDPKEMAIFFSDYGVDPIDFVRVFNSFGVRTRLQQAEARGRAYRAAGVPAIIVNGKYRITGQMAGSKGEMLLVADYLVQIEREAIGAKDN